MSARESKGSAPFHVQHGGRRQRAGQFSREQGHTHEIGTPFLFT